MRLPLLSTALAALCFAMPAKAQDMQVYGGESQRACSTLLLFGNDVLAAMTLTHGQPAWRDEHNKALDAVKGKLNRLGSDMWTTFMNNVPVEIGGAVVPAGSWVVGIACDKDGKFSLAFLDATKAMKHSTMPWMGDWKPDHTAPMTLNKDVAKEAVKLMTITMRADEKAPTNGTFTIAWGPHTLTAPMKVHVGGDKAGKEEHGHKEAGHKEHGHKEGAHK